MASKAYRDYYSRKAKIQWVRGEIQTTTNGKPLFTGDSRNFKKQEGNEMGIQDGKNLSDYDADKREEKIRDCEILRDRGLTQKQIAERTGLKLKAVQNIFYRLDAGIYERRHKDDYAVKPTEEEEKVEEVYEEMEREAEKTIANPVSRMPEPINKPDPIKPTDLEKLGISFRFDSGTNVVRLVCGDREAQISVTAKTKDELKKAAGTLYAASAMLEKIEGFMK